MVAIYHKMTGRIAFSKGTVYGLTKMDFLSCDVFFQRSGWTEVLTENISLCELVTTIEQNDIDQRDALQPESFNFTQDMSWDAVTMRHTSVYVNILGEVFSI